MADGGLEQELQTKVAGVPAWQIGLVGAAGFTGFLLWRNHRAAKAEAAQTATDTVNATSSTADPNAVDPSSPEGLTYAQEGYPTGPIDSYLAGNPTSTAYPVGGTPQGLPGPVTNAQWARLAADVLIGKGDDPTLVNDALNAYISGQPVTTAEQAVINLAIQTLGEPPEGVMPVVPEPGAPPPNPAPVPVPPPSPVPGPGPIPRPRPRPVPPHIRILQYKVKLTGTTSTLNELAKRFHTTPEEIVRTTGVGRGHGPAWNAYAARRNWNARLPHGTNLDIPEAVTGQGG